MKAKLLIRSTIKSKTIWLKNQTQTYLTYIVICLVQVPCESSIAPFDEVWLDVNVHLWIRYIDLQHSKGFLIVISQHVRILH